MISHKVRAGVFALGLMMAALPGSAFAWEAQVVGGGANLRDGVWSNIVGFLSGGSRVDILADHIDHTGSLWHQIQTPSGALGWVYGLLVRHPNAVTPSPDGLASGTATWYGPGFHGKLMANGEVYNMYDPTIAAANVYELGTRLRVTHINNGRSIVVRVTDTGGFDKINPSTVLDLSFGAFSAIADPDDGRIPVRVEPA